jgi:hypothetical protein
VAEKYQKTTTGAEREEPVWRYNKNRIVLYASSPISFPSLSESISAVLKLEYGVVSMVHVASTHTNGLHFSSLKNSDRGRCYDVKIL